MIEKKLIAVTGASGWLACHIIVQLLDKGYLVRGTVRDVKKSSFLLDLHPLARSNLTLIKTDLLVSDNWEDAFRNCYAVIHTASPFSFAVRSDDELVKPAVLGVENVINAVMKCNVTKLIMTSSVCSIVYGHPPERYGHSSSEKHMIETEQKRINSLIDAKSYCLLDCEECKNYQAKNIGSTVCGDIVKDLSFLTHLRTSYPFPQKLGSWKCMSEDDYSNQKSIHSYEKSKTMAEKRAWELVKYTNICLTVLCPGFIFGPILNERHGMNESSEHIKRLLTRKFPVIPRVTSSHVDVRDVAECHILAMEGDEQQVKNQRIIIACDDGNISFVEQALLLSKHLAVYGFKIPKIIAPDIIIRLGSYFSSAANAAVDKLNKPVFTTNEKAHKLLRMTSWRRVEASLLEHALSLIKYKLVDKKKIPDILFK